MASSPEHLPANGALEGFRGLTVLQYEVSLKGLDLNSQSLCSLSPGLERNVASGPVISDDPQHELPERFEFLKIPNMK